MKQVFLARCPVCGEADATEVVSFPQLSFGRCAGCGLLYKREQDPALPRKYESEYFEQGGARYLERWAHRVRKSRRHVLACLEFAPHARSLLDVGCSAGYVLEAARSLGLREAGLDVSAYTVELCRQRGLRAEQGTLTALPFADGEFDVVTAKHTLEHVQDPLKGLAELRRVLAPGGVALIVVPDAAYLKIRLRPRTGSSLRPDGLGWQHHVYFSGRNLVDACTRAGFETLLTSKALFRRRLASGLRAPAEAARYVGVGAWAHLAFATGLRRELFHIVRKAG